MTNYKKIYTEIKETHDKNVEIEWIENFMMDAIIKNETTSLINIYAIDTYEKFNFNLTKKIKNETKKIKNDTSCSVVCGLMSIFILLCIIISCVITTFIYIVCTANDIASITMAMIGIIGILIAWCFAILSLCYNICYKSFVEYKNIYMKERDSYVTKKKAYFAV
jgi:hypothetical protein